jgi:molybdopterin-dependent oxidoreductase alpha subunit
MTKVNKEKGPGLGKIKKSAVGLPAILSTLNMGLFDMGPGKSTRVMRKMNQFDGFDCPGCAWPDPDDERTPFGEYCENGIKAIATEVDGNIINARFFKNNSIEDLKKKTEMELGKSGRIAEPMVKLPGATHYTPIEWEEAFHLIANHLNALSSPDEAVFYTSGRTSNEAAFMYQWFAREFGTNNLPDCSHLCHESSAKAMMKTVGVSKGSVTLNDFEKTDLVIILGQNPGSNHPRMLTSLEKCKKNGGKIISINPIPEAGLSAFKNPKNLVKVFGKGTILSDLYLPVTINGDIPLLKAILQLLFYEERKRPDSAFDIPFIYEHTEGYEAFASHLLQQDFNNLADASGVERGLIKQAVEMIRVSKKMIICWSMGLTQHENAVENIQEVINLLLVKGAFGKEGSGPCPVRGHSNVQGDRTMGITEAPTETLLKNLKEISGFTPPEKPGYTVVEAIKAMESGKARVFISLGGNLASAAPDASFTAKALQKCALTVQISTKLNRSHLETGETALILPCLARSEKDISNGNVQLVSTENAMGIVQSSKGVLPPCSPYLKSESAIVAGMAQHTLPSSKTLWKSWASNYDEVREVIEKVIPGFQDFNTRLRKKGGFVLPNSLRENTFPTPSGKAQFTINEVPDLSLPAGTFRMMTIRSHDQFNTSVYGLIDRYRGIKNDRKIAMMNKKDMETLGLKPKQKVDLSNPLSPDTLRLTAFSVVPYPIPTGCIATYFPEANALISIRKTAKNSQTPVYKSSIITVSPTI